MVKAMLRIFTFLFLYLASVQSLHAETYSKKINFQHVLEKYDIALGEVRSIIQDSDGFMWFGGETALIRYDGYQLKKVDFLENTGSNLGELKPVSVVNRLYQATDGTIWVASWDGLLKYDPRLDSLSRLPDHESLQKTPLSTMESKDLVELPNGDMAVATANGLFIVNPNTGSGQRIGATGNVSISHDSVNRVLYSNHMLWVGTLVGLDRVNIETGQVQQYKPYSPKADSASDNGIFAMESGKSGRLWLGTNNGLIDFDPQTLSFQRFLDDTSSTSGLVSSDIWDIYKDSRGDLWLSIDGGGVSIFDPSNKTVVSYLNSSTRIGSLASDVARTVMEDSSGDMWIGLYPSGVDFFDRSSVAIESFTADPSSKESIYSNAVVSITEDAQKNLWLSIGGGLEYFNRKDGVFTHFLHDPNDANTIGITGALNIIIDSENQLWGGTWTEGAFYFDLKTMKKTNLPSDEKRVTSPGVSYSNRLNNNKVWSVLEDENGYIWLCTHEGGISRYDKKTGEFIHYTYDKNNKNTIASNLVWTAFVDSKRNFWLGTSQGLALLDRNTGLVTRFQQQAERSELADQVNILSIFEDSKHQLWLGTDAGLVLFDVEAKRFTTYGIKNGFIDDTIRSIVEDQTGKLWMGSNNGVIIFNPETKKVKNFNREAGKLVGKFNLNAALMTDSGEAIFGGINGLKIFRADMIGDNKIVPKVVLTDFKLFSDSVLVGNANGVLNKSIQYTNEIILDHAQSVFEFEFSALSFRDPEKNNYTYRLNGFDKNWVDAGSQRRAKYTNLDSGTYTFEVKGSNNDGYWNEKPTSIKVKILPPWWHAWWAYAIYFGTTLLLICWGFHTYRTKIAYEKEKLLRATEKLRKEHEIQQEKMAGLSSLVAGMAHEFNNPLNFFKAGSYNVEMDVGDLRSLVEDLFSEQKDDEFSEILERFNDLFSSILNSLSSMNDGTDRIRSLVEDLHAFSRIGKGGKESVSIVDLFRDCVDWVAKNKYDSNVECVVDIEQDCNIYCCPGSMQQALINIVENGCQSIVSYQKREGILSKRQLKLVATVDTDELTIRIIDSGSGMTPKDLKHIFEPFYTGKPIGEGTGLGMAIAFSAIDGEGGRITVKSEIGMGAEIMIRLPRV